MNSQADAMVVAKEFFFPRGYWAGWARFFSPHLPGRVGNPLISVIVGALKGSVIDARHAIDMLESTYVKQVNSGPYAGVEMICEPTDDAREAVRLLKNVYGREIGIDDDSRRKASG